VQVDLREEGEADGDERHAEGHGTVRAERRLFLADGPRAVEGALSAGCLVELFVSPAAAEAYAALVADADRVFVVDDRALASLSDSVSPAGLVAVWAQATVGSGGHSVSAYLAYFGAGLSGAALLARLALEALTLVAVIRGWRSLPLFLGGSLVMLAAAGHAAGVQPAWLGVGLDAVHLLAAGVWAGGIGALALLRPPGGWRSVEARRLLGRFTPVALAAFATTVVAGGLEAIEQLGSLQSLFGTDYGRVLLAKMALVACMLPLSLLAWRLGRPRVRVEASIAVCVVAAV